MIWTCQQISFKEAGIKIRGRFSVTTVLGACPAGSGGAEANPRLLPTSIWQSWERTGGPTGGESHGDKCRASDPFCCLLVFSWTAPATARGWINSQALHKRAERLFKAQGSCRWTHAVLCTLQVAQIWGAGVGTQRNLLRAATRGILLCCCRGLRMWRDECRGAPALPGILLVAASLLLTPCHPLHRLTDYSVFTALNLGCW